VQLLIDSGADKEAKNIGGNTALISAAENGHVGCVRALMDAGADQEVKNDGGFTALDRALRYNHHGAAQAISSHAQLAKVRHGRK
jgi:ankyrin repeat protein